jgi:molybdopterin-containing oxidoreductase family iron-sulfur binding subunit
MPPDQIIGALRQLAGRLGAGPQEWARAENAHLAWIKALADDLNQNKGKTLLHAGREQGVEVHLLTDAINHALGAFGSTVSLIAPVEAITGSKRQSISDLADDMASRKVDTLIILDANPVYDAPPELDFAARLRGVPFSVSLARYDDETAVACKWRIPAVHEYESWSDARAFDGTVTILQPQARPLYGGRAAHEILAVLLGDTSPDSYKLLRDFWRQRVQEEKRGDFEDFWHQALQVGIVPDTAEAPLSITPGADIAAQLQGDPAPAKPGLQALFRADEGNWDGRYANNPWLLEMPRAFTRLTWDNAALIAPATANRLDLKTDDVVEISFEKVKLKAPVYVLPGQAGDCITLPLGWGRTVGGLAAGAGFDAYRAGAARSAGSQAALDSTRTRRAELMLPGLSRLRR